jgi:hypothetical protein
MLDLLDATSIAVPEVRELYQIFQFEIQFPVRVAIDLEVCKLLLERGLIRRPRRWRSRRWRGVGSTWDNETDSWTGAAVACWRAGGMGRSEWFGA